MLYPAVLCLLLATGSLASYCSDPATNDQGPCMNNACPLPGTTCVMPADICCNDAAIRPDTTTALTTTTLAAPTAPAAATSAATVAPGSPTTTTTYAPVTTTFTVPPPITSTPTAAPVTAAPPATSCADKIPATDKNNCATLAYLCNDRAYFDLMTENCPSTCNRCATTSPGPANGCTDLLNPLTGVSDCPNKAAFCQNTMYYKLMTEQCPKTCNRCVTTPTPTSAPVVATCADLLNPKTGVSDCPGRANLCQNAVYYNLMTQQCPKTCKRCAGVATPTPSTPAPVLICSDKIDASTNKSNCVTMAAYCDNATYYNLMTEQCPKTCKRCPTG